MVRALALASVLSVSCAGTATIDRAQLATDLARELLTMIDDAFAPVWTAALAAANREHPTDDVAYHAALAPQEKVFHLIEQARRRHAVLVIAILSWEQTDNPSWFQREVPCVIQAFDELAQGLADADLAQAVRTADATLRDVADQPLAPCPRAQ